MREFYLLFWRFCFCRSAQTRALEVQCRQARRRKRSSMEETMTTAEVQEQTSDAFLDGWNDTVAAETADQPEFAEEAEVSEDSADQLEHAQEERTAEESQQEESLDILDAGTQEVPSEPVEKEAAPKTW